MQVYEFIRPFVTYNMFRLEVHQNELKFNMKIRYLILLLAVVFGDDGTDNKIIGGELARVGEFPYIVSIQTPYLHSCGGSLLRDSVVLTACHCIVFRPDDTDGRLKTKPASDYTVVAGIVNLANKKFSSYRRLQVNAVKPHPKCEKPNTGWNWDFGLVQLRGSFQMIPEKIQTVELPKFPELQGMIESVTELGVHCVGAGWGVTAERARTSSLELLKVDLKLMPLETCEHTLKKYAESTGSPLRFKPEAQVCTIGENGKDACKGDSGGPLLCDTSPFTKNNTEDTKLELIATVSWGIGCGRPDVPGGWARLDVAYDWIVTTMEELERTAPSGENGIFKKNINAQLLFFAIIINAFSYSLS